MQIKYDKDLDAILQQKYQKYGWRITSHLNKDENRYLIEYIKSITPLLDSPKYTLGTKIYWALNHIIDFPKCQNPNCNNKLDKNVTIKHGYRQKYCSCKCLNTDNKKQEHVKQTCLERYGVENPYQSEEIKEKIKETQRKKYDGVIAAQAEVVLQKRKTTCLKKFGTEFAGASSTIHKHGQQTCLERYGVENPYQSEEIKEKIRQTWKSHGYEHPMKSADVVKKILQPHYQKFIDNVNEHEKQYIDILSTAEELAASNGLGKWKCKKCGNVFESKISHIFSLNDVQIHGRCPKCYPISAIKSALEYDVKNFISSIYFGKIISANESRMIIPPKELDIYLPEKKIAFEVDGLYWHADDLGTNSNYHLQKTEACEKQGIQLIHIFENEWKLKRKIVESRIKNLLGIYGKTIYARKCVIKEVDSKQSKAFQEVNHIQGAVNSSVNLGLFYDNELIGLMTFSKTRFSKKYEWELVRYCSKLGYHVPGAAGKLLKHFERNWKPRSLVSYADRRWSQGKVYKALGFTLDHISAPNYWYFKNLNLESRIKYQKHKLPKLLADFDAAKNESENMISNGYHRIFDCGNLVFVKQF